jgi:hypothetical protein
MKKSRTLLAVAAGVAGLVAFAGPAQAAPPNAEHQTVDLPGTDTEQENGFCPFAVHIEVDTNQLPAKVTTYPETSPVQEVQKYTGSAVATVTGNGNTVELKISGPGTITIFRDGAFALDVHGQNLLWTTVANSAEDVPQLAYTTGHVKVHVEASGFTDSYKLNGRSTDVCALLA